MGAMITTKDNPYDPREDFGAWYAWDITHGYFTSSYLANLAALPDDYPESAQEIVIEKTIDQIIAIHNGEIYEKLMTD